MIDAVGLSTRVFRGPAADGYREAHDFAASKRIVAAFAPEVFAPRLDELEIE